MNTPVNPQLHRQLIAALDELADVADANIARSRQIKKRLAALRKQIESGQPITDTVRNEPRPLIVELISENIAALNQVGAKLRWSEATALREEGLTVADIARLFGVSRQRVSDLLLDPPAAVSARRSPPRG